MTPAFFSTRPMAALSFSGSFSSTRMTGSRPMPYRAQVGVVEMPRLSRPLAFSLPSSSSMIALASFSSSLAGSPMAAISAFSSLWAWARSGSRASKSLVVTASGIAFSPTITYGVSAGIISTKAGMSAAFGGVVPSAVVPSVVSPVLPASSFLVHPAKARPNAATSARRVIQSFMELSLRAPRGADMPGTERSRIAGVVTATRSGDKHFR